MAVKSNNWNQFSSFDGEFSFVNTYGPEQGFMDRSVRMGRDLRILFGTGEISNFLPGPVRSEINWSQSRSERPTGFGPWITRVGP